MGNPIFHIAYELMEVNRVPESILLYYSLIIEKIFLCDIFGLSRGVLALLKTSNIRIVIGTISSVTFTESIGSLLY